MKKFFGFLILSIILIAGGFCLCYFGLGDKVKALVDSAKAFIQ